MIHKKQLIVAWVKQRIFLFISVIMLLIASSYTLNENLPYGYYQILRLLVCGTSAYFAYLCYQQARKNWTWILGITAVLFNPFMPIRFDKETWQFIDFITAILLSVFAIRLTKK